MKDDKENGTNLKSIFSDFHSASEDLKTKLNESINFRIAVSILSRNEFHLYWEAFNPDKPFPTISNTSVLLPGNAAAVISNVPRVAGRTYDYPTLNELFKQLRDLNIIKKKYGDDVIRKYKKISDRTVMLSRNKPSDDEVATTINDLHQLLQNLH